MTVAEFDTRRKYLEVAIATKIGEHDEYRKKYQFFNRLLIFASISFSALITIAGIYNLAEVAAILGVVTGAMVALQNAYNLNENIAFHRRFYSKYKVLHSDLMIEVREFKQLVELQDHFAEILAGEVKNPDDNTLSYNTQFKQLKPNATNTDDTEKNSPDAILGNSVNHS